MKVEFKEENYVNFDTLDNGETFLYQGWACMKLPAMNVMEDEDDEIGTIYNGAVLNNGDLLSMQPSALVRPTKFKLVEV